MKLISLNVARPRLVVYNGATINTGIFKQPVSGPVQLRTLNLDGDRQADLTVHGGPYKAVYAYPSEHYNYWRQQLPGVDLPWGRFGGTDGSPAPHAMLQISCKIPTRGHDRAFPAQRPQRLLFFCGAGR